MEAMTYSHRRHYYWGNLLAWPNEDLLEELLFCGCAVFNKSFTHSHSTRTVKGKKAKRIVALEKNNFQFCRTVFCQPEKLMLNHTRKKQKERKEFKKIYRRNFSSNAS